MSSPGGILPVAVSTLVLAAMAVSEASACPLGRAVDLEQPALPWITGVFHAATPPSATPKATPDLAVLAAVGDGAGVVHVLERVEFRCVRGHGELVLRVTRGRAAVTVSGFEPRMADCVRHAIEDARFTRVAGDTLVRVALALR